MADVEAKFRNDNPTIYGADQKIPSATLKDLYLFELLKHLEYKNVKFILTRKILYPPLV